MPDSKTAGIQYPPTRHHVPESAVRLVVAAMRDYARGSRAFAAADILYTLAGVFERCGIAYEHEGDCNPGTCGAPERRQCKWCGRAIEAGAAGCLDCPATHQGGGNG